MDIHVIQPGDTVWELARQYGVSPERIISDNRLINPRNLVVGQALLILQPETVYTIRPGDTLASIAAQFGVPVITLYQNNPELTTAPALQPGRTITIRFAGGKTRALTVNAYAYPDIRRDVLSHALPSLTYLTIFGYGFTTEGELIGIDDQPLINLAYQFGAAPVMLLSSITEEGTFSGERASLLFRDAALQNKVLDNILLLMREKGYVGLDVDFEYIQPEDSAAYVDFLQNAAARLHAEGYFVHADLAPKTSSQQRGLLYEAHDYGSIGAVSDTVLLMTYEWGYTYGPPLAVAPLNRVREVVAYAITQIPAQKILMGIPNYGYDWALPFERGVSRATSIGNEYAVQIAARYGAEILYDEIAQSPHFNYWSGTGAQHEVWFEDIRSIQAKCNLMDEFGLLGCGYWNAMRPFVQNWLYLSYRYNIRKVV
ncbi:MAG: LysM peptidoglycan-binding domain-containing protein [Oscillospiraceae bacterium]